MLDLSAGNSSQADRDERLVQRVKESKAGPDKAQGQRMAERGSAEKEEALKQAAMAGASLCSRHRAIVKARFSTLGVISFVNEKANLSSGEGDAVGHFAACDAHGHQLLLETRETTNVNGPPSIRSYRVPGWPSPVVVAVVPYYRANGVSLSPIVVTETLGRLRSILPSALPNDRSFALDSDDALCLGPVSADANVAGLAIIRRTHEDYRYIGSPKYFTATELIWANGVLVAGSAHTTRRRHANWRSALRELRLSCPLEVSRSTLAHGRQEPPDISLRRPSRRRSTGH